jgi:hypothetical protein
MGKDVRRYVGGNQYEFRRDRDRSGESFIDIGMLVSLPPGVTIVMKVVEHLDPPEDSMICPNSNCDYLIKFNEIPSTKGEIHW